MRNKTFSLSSLLIKSQLNYPNKPTHNHLLMINKKTFSNPNAIKINKNMHNKISLFEKNKKLSNFNKPKIINSLMNTSKFNYSLDYKQASEVLSKNNSRVFPKKITHFINGEFYEIDQNTKNTSNEPYEKLNIINPTTEETLESFYEATQKEIDLAVKSAESAFSEWNSLALDIRVKLFMDLATKLEQNILEFSVLESIDNGKVLRDSCEDIKEVIRLLRYYGGFIDKQFGTTISAIDELTIQTRRVPYGVVGCISPWNYPLLMAAWKIIPALCAGNAVILKPSEEAPLTMLKFCELVAEVGFPKGFLNVVLGRGPKTGSLLTHSNSVSKVCFTGSTNAGKQVMISAAESNMKGVQLELGGKSPLIIFADADLENAANWVVHGAFFNTSQNCICSSRILIEEKIYDKFIELIVEKTAKLKVGKYDDDSADLGPLINKRQFDRYFEYLAIAKQENLQLRYGGNDLRNQFTKGFFVDPAIFINVPDESALAKQEIFAPILSILKPFNSTEEAVKRANDSIYGLAAGVFSSDLNKIEFFVRNIQSGNVHVNCNNLSPYNVPFGGMKQSGFGRDCGADGIMEFTQSKSVFYYTDFKKI